MAIPRKLSVNPFGDDQKADRAKERAFATLLKKVSFKCKACHSYYQATGHWRSNHISVADQYRCSKHKPICENCVRIKVIKTGNIPCCIKCEGKATRYRYSVGNKKWVKV